MPKSGAGKRAQRPARSSCQVQLGVGEVPLGVGEVQLGVGEVQLEVGEVQLGVGEVTSEAMMRFQHHLNNNFVRLQKLGR